jgi:hypothetical protein
MQDISAALSPEVGMEEPYRPLYWTYV